MALFSTSVPVLEAHLSNEPLALVHFPDRRVQYFKIKTLGDPDYFIIYNKKLKGIFKKDPAVVEFMGKTPIYNIDAKNCKPFDPVIVGELNHFAKKNQLHEITQTDVKHAGWLRTMLKRKNGHSRPHKPTKEEKAEAMKELEKMASEAQIKIDDEISQLAKEVEEEEKKEIKDQDTGVVQIAKVPEKQKQMVLLERLVQKDLLSIAEKDLLEQKIRANQLNFRDLVKNLQKHEIITISEPIDARTQLFLNQFSTDNPTQLATFVEALTKEDKGLKRMTSIPVKNWIPGTVILFGAIGLIMFLVMLPNIIDSISSIGGGGTGFKLPFGLFLSKLFGV